MKRNSCLLAVPSEQIDITDMKGTLDRLHDIDDLQIHDMKYDEETDNFVITMEFEEEHYLAELYFMEKEIPDMCKQSHYLTEEEKEKINANKTGVCIEMEFGADAMKSYHLQIKLLCAAVPDAVALFDYGGCQVLSGEWARLTAASKVPPAPQYMFSVHAVSDDAGIVWLHSHGLNRCGMPELEVLKSTTESYKDHNQVLECLAVRLAEKNEPPEVKEPIYLAELANDTSLMVTTVDWEEAIEFLGEPFVGDHKDRFEGHIENTRAIFVYESEAEYKKESYQSLSIYDDILNDNPLYFISNSETDRMKALACERLSFIREAVKDEKNTILLKLGLMVDEEHRTETNSKEHIWFELQEFDGDNVKALLTQEPYYIAGLKEGDEGIYSTEEITDWLIFTPECRISPDSVYLLKTYRS